MSSPKKIWTGCPGSGPSSGYWVPKASLPNFKAQLTFHVLREIHRRRGPILCSCPCSEEKYKKLKICTCIKDSDIFSQVYLANCKLVLIYCLLFLVDSDFNINRDAFPYIKVAIMTRQVPIIKYPPGIRSFRTR